jgi:hypothetical protein
MQVRYVPAALQLACLVLCVALSHLQLVLDPFRCAARADDAGSFVVLQATSTTLKDVQARLEAAEIHGKDLQQQLTAARHQAQGQKEELTLVRGQLRQLPLLQQQLQTQTELAEQLRVRLLLTGCAATVTLDMCAVCPAMPWVHAEALPDSVACESAACELQP